MVLFRRLRKHNSDPLLGGAGGGFFFCLDQSSCPASRSHCPAGASHGNTVAFTHGKVDVAVPATLSAGNARKVPDPAGTAASTT